MIEVSHKWSLLKNTYKELTKTYENILKTDFGWINFLSGIMISSAVNIGISCYVSEKPSTWEVAAGIAMGVSSVFLFLIYQKLSRIKVEVQEDIQDWIDTSQKIRDYEVLEDLRRKAVIEKYFSGLTRDILLAYIMGVLGVVIITNQVACKMVSA